MILSTKPSVVRRSVSGAEVCERERREGRLTYQEEFANREMSMDYAQLVWHHYLSAGADLTPISTLREQDALTQSASPVASAALGEAEIPDERALKFCSVW